MAAQQRARKAAIPTYMVRDTPPRMVKGAVQMGNRTVLVCLGPVSLLRETLGSLEPVS